MSDDASKAILVRLSPRDRRAVRVAAAFADQSMQAWAARVLREAAAPYQHTAPTVAVRKEPRR